MRKLSALIFALTITVVLVYHASQAQTQTTARTSGAAIPGTKGGQDMFGGYEIVKGWPKDISTLPGNGKWTYGAGQGVYAESPNRVFMLFRGELPNIRRPATKLLPDFGPSIQFPIGRLPWRDATVASLPGGGGAGAIPGAPTDGWSGTVGVDAKWENCIVVADANGNIVEGWTQWDKILQRLTSGPSSHTIPRSTSGLLMITCTRSTSSRMTEKNSCRPSALPKRTEPTVRTSIVRPSWPGFPTARCSSPTDTTEHASRSSIKTASSSST